MPENASKKTIQAEWQPRALEGIDALCEPIYSFGSLTRRGTLLGEAAAPSFRTLEGAARPGDRLRLGEKRFLIQEVRVLKNQDGLPGAYCWKLQPFSK